jgi:O-acetyl-ADP-ribose deacetylase (regulator of RNase III)
MEIVKGDALNTNADILLHQVNLQGIMGGGIAYQIAKTYPNVEKEYKSYKNKELGNVLFVKTEKYVIGNCFSQKYNFDTDYEALKKCLYKVVEYMKKNNFKSVAIPYKYGCGIANGDWNIVEKIFDTIITENGFKLTAYRL